MLIRSASQHSQKVALLLLAIFYAEMATSVYAASVTDYKRREALHNRYVHNYPAFAPEAFLASPSPSIKGENIRTIPGSGENSQNTVETNEVQEADEVSATDVFDTGGPGQPEMSSFRSASTDNLVNLFTGDFSYNIPLFDLGGYPVNIFYSAGITMDQEATWVGLGWNLNPGTISRNMRGLPDDYNGEDDKITNVQSINPDKTIGVSYSKGMELAGYPGFSGSTSLGVFYNNRRGLGLEAGVQAEYNPQQFLASITKDDKTLIDTIKGMGLVQPGVSGSLKLNSQNGLTVNAGLAVYLKHSEIKNRIGLSTSIGYNSRMGLTDLSIDAEKQRYKIEQSKMNDGNMASHLSVHSSLSYHVSTISFARTSHTPTIRMPLTRDNKLLSIKLGKEKKAFFKGANLSGYMQTTSIHPADTFQQKPAYGYMYQGKAANDRNAIMDFNRLNDGTFTMRTPLISVPSYTYDVFSINGEGTGGSFRGYHGGMSFVKDNITQSRSGSFQLYLDLGAGNIFKGGTSLGGSYALSESGDWEIGNLMRENSKLKPSDRLYQGFYFKNPAEKAIIDEDFYNGVGGDQLIRPYLLNTKIPSPLLASGYRVIDKYRNPTDALPVNDNLRRENRDKRSQAISFLTAEEADLVGLDKLIYSYTENEFKPGSCDDPLYKVGIRRYSDIRSLYRRKHHISQVNVLESDGRRYVYGLPVYQITQKEVTFSVTGTAQDRLVQYESYSQNPDNPDNSVFNKKGRDGFYQREELGGYAHSYLLTGILSPDYVDVTGDGITEDDLGTAVKFNYSRANRYQYPSTRHPQGANLWYPYRWRMPVAQDKAIHNEGLKSDDRDDKGMYTYGEKELWYLHSIESKNMVACFYTSNRNDGKQVKDENGGLSNTNSRLKKLDSIRVFTKAEFLAWGDAGKPVKTVHFSYSYKLCQNYPLNGTVGENSGKLTLEAIWFTYNNHQKVVKNKYLFRYGVLPNNTVVNPSYHAGMSDRWGNYKGVAGNPQTSGINLSNTDYPYAEQNKELADQFAAAWNLTDILLPSGGTMSVQYESDDYAFVQDRRASGMTKIAGFGPNSSGPASVANRIYEFDFSMRKTPHLADHRFVFFDLPEELATKEEIATYYLQDFKQLLMRLWVKMPKGNFGQQPAYEPVMVYAGIKDYGFVTDPGEPDGFDHTRFYIEMEPTQSGGSPVVETVFQFLREHLPQRAFPGYEVKGDGPIKEVARAVWGLINSFVDGVTRLEVNFKADKKAREVDLNFSGARLNQPDFKKLGGGHRVKKIVIGDNWSKLLKRSSESAKLDSWYGQEYDYSTPEQVMGAEKVISSGVATYEPGIGNEENPFREVLQYYTTQPLGPTTNDNIELPFGETFFPSTMVGYSRVTVRSIHNKTNKRLKSGVGLQQTVFYTSRDFPVLMDYTSFDKESRSRHKPGFINKVFEFRLRDYVTVTQGFRIVLNDMNGKLRSQASFPENDYKSPINYTAYHYRLIPRGDGKYRLDNRIPVINGPDGKISYRLIGKDVEVMNDFRQNMAITRSAQIPLNADVFTIGGFPFLLPTFFRLIFGNESRYRSASTLKIVNEYGILDSIINIDKGSVVGTRNLVYDGETGNVLLTRTTNEFKDPIYQFNYPAWWVHSGMEPAYFNLDMQFSGLVFQHGLLDAPPQELIDNLESGDELLVMYSDSEGPFETEACIRAGSTLRLSPGTEPLIWAVDIRKDERNTEKKFVFLDRNGVPFNAKNATVRVIRSGKRNMSGASSGSFVSMLNPIKEVAENDWRIVVDNNTGVLNAGAVEYRERWRANDQFYAVDSTIVTVRQTPLNILQLGPQDVYSLTNRTRRENNNTVVDVLTTNASLTTTKYRFRSGGRRYFADTKSWMRLDLPSDLQGSTIYSASLILPGHKAPHANAVEQFHEIRINDHTALFPHHIFNLTDHTLSTTLKFSRMLNTWGSSSNISHWVNMFNDNPLDDLVNNNTLFTPPIMIADGSFSGDYQVNIRELMQGMVDNYSNPNHGKGIKLSFLKDSRAIDQDKKGGPWRFCFHTNGPNEVYCKCPIPGVRVSLEYYKCQPTDQVVYSGVLGNAPTTPPAGYVYCTEETIAKICLSTFDKKQMNPYIQGILGNWRGYRSYVFYGERKESDFTNPTDIRKDGQLKEFVHYWAFHDEKLQKTDDARWVWNSEITQYNRKGAELENRDPLNRYNSGIYGYQESLPVAVVNNSKLRLSAFDGFEDYSYQDDPCQPFCEPTRRHFYTGISTSMLTTSSAHTGRHSLKVNMNQTYSMNLPMWANDEVYNPDQRIQILETDVQNVVRVNPNGQGLTGAYYAKSDFTELETTREDAFIGHWAHIKISRPLDWKDEFPFFLPDDVSHIGLSVRWTGSLQPNRTGEHEFYCTVDDEVIVYIKEKTASEWTRVLEQDPPNGVMYSVPIHLLAGDLYDIRVDFVQHRGLGFINMKWRQPDANGALNADVPFVTVPSINLYPIGKESLANGTVISETGICEKPDTIQAIAHQFIDSFALIPGQKMVASVWVKKSGADCNCDSYNDLSLLIRDASGNIIGTLQPKENIIEGWQLMEAVFTAPATGDKVTLEFNATASQDLLLDDLRLHPFNANMKSFVYDPVTLRLVADLDENNFASLYEYDHEGTLIRVKKETRAGIKTITETRSAIQKELTEF